VRGQSLADAATLQSDLQAALGFFGR
jgi:hypothetical protein